MSEAEWVETKLQQLFAPAQWPQARQLLQQYGAQDWQREPDRVRLALLKLSAGDLEQLRVWLQTAQQDYRDVLVGAEYRQQSTFDSWNLDHESRRALKEARKSDFQELMDWLNHEPDKGEFMTDSSKHTGDEAASAASKVLTDGRTSETSKAAAGSALSQAEHGADKSTGDAAAHAASETLLNDETGDNSKKAAASALAQKTSDDS